MDVNSENVDDLTALDVATMLGHDDIARLLLSHGAQESPRCMYSIGESLKTQLFNSTITVVAPSKIGVAAGGGAHASFGD